MEEIRVENCNSRVSTPICTFNTGDNQLNKELKKVTLEYLKNHNGRWNKEELTDVISMNATRFAISLDNNQNIYDSEEKCYYSSIDAKKLCDLLNEQHEENKRLKSDLIRTKILLDSMQDKYSGLLKLVHGFIGDVE